MCGPCAGRRARARVGAGSGGESLSQVERQARRERVRAELVAPGSPGSPGAGGGIRLEALVEPLERAEVSLGPVPGVWVAPRREDSPRGEPGGAWPMSLSVDPALGAEAAGAVGSGHRSESEGELPVSQPFLSQVEQELERDEGASDPLGSQFAGEVLALAGMSAEQVRQVADRGSTGFVRLLEERGPLLSQLIEEPGPTWRAAVPSKRWVAFGKALEPLLAGAILGRLEAWKAVEVGMPSGRSVAILAQGSRLILIVARRAAP